MSGNTEVTTHPLVETHFAPAERASEVTIAEEARLVHLQTAIGPMLDAVPDIILVLNEHRQTVLVNAAGRQAFGVNTERDAFGLRPGELLRCINATIEPGGCGTSEFCRTCGAVRAVLGGLRGVDSVQECQITQENGNSLDLRVWARPFRVGDVVYCLVTVKDISDEKRRVALERIFFHDVLNTASFISMCVDALKQDPSAVTEIVDELSSVSKRLTDEIQAQRSLVQAESGDLLANPMPLDATALLTEIGLQYQTHGLALQRPVQLDSDLSPALMESDPTLLGRVIGNMVKNALEATKSGGTVTLSLSATDDEVTFAVHNPTFIPRHIQLQIFNRSFSTKGSGRGLGTYSMRMLSERYLHGSVWFDSTQEEGTTFYARYPRTWLVTPAAQ